MLNVRLQSFHLKSVLFQHSPPFAGTIFADVGFIVIGIQKIHAPIHKIVFRHASIIDDNPSPTTQNAPHFGDGLIDVGEVMSCPAAGDEIEGFIAKRKVMHIPGLKGDIAQASVPANSFCLGKHGLGKIDPDYRIDMGGECECRVSCSSGNVEDMPVRLWLCQFHNALEYPGIRVSRTGRVKRRSLSKDCTRLIFGRFHRAP